MTDPTRLGDEDEQYFGMVDYITGLIQSLGSSVLNRGKISYIYFGDPNKASLWSRPTLKPPINLSVNGMFFVSFASFEITCTPNALHKST